MKTHLGIAMIEVLTAMGIISLVLLSLLSYQISMIKNLYQTNLKNIATIQLMNFSEMLRANKQARHAALSAWNKDNAAILPQGQGDYSVVDDHQCEITVSWVAGKQETESIVIFC